MKLTALVATRASRSVCSATKLVSAGCSIEMRLHHCGGGYVLLQRSGKRDFLSIRVKKIREINAIKRAHLSAPALQKRHQNSTERISREEGKERIMRRERGKSANFWPPHPSGSHFFWVWAPTLRAPHPPALHFFWAPDLHSSVG